MGSNLIKFNHRDGKAGTRRVHLTDEATPRIMWVDPQRDGVKLAAKGLRVRSAIALLHGAKSSAFFKGRGVRTKQDWLCFSLVFKGRTLDFAATNVEALLHWYIGLASLMPHSSEPLLDEAALRKRMEAMISF